MKNPLVIRSLARMASWALAHGAECGLVPTLGSLHEGHVSLIRRARRENRFVVVSVFINPLQFREKQYRLYPRDLSADVALAARAGADVVFAPTAEEMYPAGFEGGIVLPKMFRLMKAQKLEWHYRGVLVVVMKLFQAVRPRRAYFGLKDPHQLALIERMVADFNVPVVIRKCPTVRENDGLARSSRNALLTEAERKAAPVIYRSLVAGKKVLRDDGGRAAEKAAFAARKILSGEKLARVEHIEVVDPFTFAPLRKDSREALIHAAVWIGQKRLADNLRFKLR
ncbi:MAG: pantoate--beta-alanine ligase [Nitrospinae bacterium]|nr:pantoate--beta-alanine ligase [Nitrospinota bacterium]